MTKDTPSPTGGGGRYSPKKPPASPSPAMLLEELRRELETVGAELEAERVRSQAERRRFASETRALREAGERERQQLAEQLRSRWEMQRARELRQLREAVLRERDTEIRQLLRWKEAELRQLQLLLHKERDCAVRQARELQRQLAEELLSRGHCGRPGSAAVGAVECRCKLQDVLAKLRWETDGEQAARIRHLQAALDVERSLFLKYILENFHWDPASVFWTRPPRPNLGRPEPGAAAAAAVVAVRFQAAGAGELPTAGAGELPTAGAGELPTAGVGELPAPAAATTTTTTAAATPASAPTLTPPGPAPQVAPATGPVCRPRPATCATRPRSLDSLRAPRPRPYSFPLDDTAARSSRSLDGSPSPAESPEAGGPLDGSPLYPAILPRPQLARDDLGTGEKAPGEAPRPSPEEPQLGCGRPPRAWGSLPRKEVPSLQQPGKEGEAGEAPLALAPRQPASAAPRHEASPELAYNDLVKQNSELAGALETLARHCSGLREENSQLRRGFPESNEKVQRLKVKNAELAVIAKRLEERARKLQETSLRAVSAPVPGESGAAPELCRRAFERQHQRAQDLTEQTSALLGKDKQIEDLRQECGQLQAQVAACQGPAQWLNVNDFDQLLRESQKEVLRLQRQVTQQNFKSPHAQRAASPPPSAWLQNPAPEEAAEAQELKLQVEALEQALSERQKCCESLELDVGKAQQRFQQAEGRLQQVLSENSWLTRENSKLQEKAQWIEKVDLENSEMRGKLELVSEERDSAALLTAQLRQQASQREARCQQLERELQDARSALAAQQGEAQRMRQAHEQMQREHREVLRTLEAQLQELERPCAQQAQEVKPPPQLRGKWAKKATCPLEGVPDSSTLAKKASTQAGASDTASGSPSHQSCPAPEMDRGSDVEELEADSLSRALEPEGPRSHHGYPSQGSQGSQDSQDSQDSHGPSKLKIFLAQYDYDPFAGPNDQPEAELPLTAGEYIYVFGDMDEDGFYAGELMDGQRGLVPSNLVEQISDSEILNLQPPEGSDSCLESSQEVKSHSENSSPERKVTGSLEVVSYGNLLPKKLEKDIMEEALDSSGVPCPSKLTLIQQLPWGVVVDWEAPFAPNTYGAMQGYNVYVDNELWQNICAGSQTRATINNLDLQTRAYRISVQSVMEKGCSDRLQCSFLVGRGFCPAPSQLRLRNLTSTSAEITWLYSSSSYPHMVYLNEQEHGLTKAGVYCYTFQNLQPSTRYCAHVEVRPARETSKKLWEEMASSITFTTPSAGPPDPPLDVLVEYHTSPGTLLVSWIPVTIDSAGSSNGVPVTGYAVYAGGQKVIEVPSPTAGTVLVEFSQIQQQKLSQEVSVRTMSHYGESLDSVPAQIPGEWLKQSSSYRSPQAFPVNHSCGELAHPQTRSTLRPFVPISQEKSILGSFDTKTSTPLPASCGSAKMVASDGFPEDSFQRGLAKPSEGDLPSPGDIKAPQGPGEAYALSPLPSSRKESHGPKTIRDSRFGNPRHLSDGQIGLEEKNARKAVPRWIQVQELLDTPPENGPMKEISRENNSGGKVPRNRVETEALKGMTQSSEAPADYSHLADLASLEEEDQYVNMWGTRRPGQKKEFRLQKGQTRLAGLKKVTPLPEPSALLYPAPSGKMTKILKTSPTMAALRPWLRAPGSSPLKGKGANDPVRVFVALWDYDPQLMSTIPETAEEGLAFQRGQLLKVWGDRDPDGFYYGECEGRVGYIPGDMVSEVQVEGGGILKKQLWQDRLPSGVSLDGLLGLSTQPPSPRKSFSMGRGAPRRAQLWHPQTMVAAFDYHPRKSASLSVTKELTLSTGDVVTVLGSVDDNGFFYGELNGQRGLVPSNLLKAPALNAE